MGAGLFLLYNAQKARLLFFIFLIERFGDKLRYVKNFDRLLFFFGFQAVLEHCQAERARRADNIGIFLERLIGTGLVYSEDALFRPSGLDAPVWIPRPTIIPGLRPERDGPALNPILNS